MRILHNLVSMIAQIRLFLAVIEEGSLRCGRVRLMSRLLVRRGVSWCVSLYEKADDFIGARCDAIRPSTCFAKANPFGRSA
jgi:hypothetical protein